MSFYQKNKKTSLFIQCLSVLISVLIAFSAYNFNLLKAGAEVESETSSVWDGETKDYNLEGTGSTTDPYLIKTAEQLAAVVTGNNNGAFTGKYFKLANDIRINDTSSANWKASAHNWVWADFRFVGIFDGDGHTIDGLYYKGSQRVMGLFSYVGADNNGTYQTTIKNFNMTNAYIESTATDGAGLVAGQASRVAYFDGIYIDDTCEINSTVKGIGGILGQSGYNVFMTNCSVHATLNGGSNVGAFVGTVSSGAKLSLKNGISSANANVQGVTDRNLASASGNIYATQKQGTVDAVVNVLTVDQMKGTAAKDNMKGLSFRYVWEIVENDFPVYNPRGDLWDGSWVTSHDDFEGKGTEKDPYLIENAAQLAFATSKNSNLTDESHYKIVKDIVLNDTSVENWENGARSWFWNDKARFNGELDGNGHTIEGLYMNTSANGRLGLFAYVGKASSGSTHVATIKNIKFVNASINNPGSGDSLQGAAIVAGQASGETVFENIYIDETCKVNAPNIKGVAGIVGRGYNQNSNAHITIKNSAVLATINGGSHVGAFCGTFWDTKVNLTITNSFANTSCGLVGGNSGTTVIENTYSTVVGEKDTGATLVSAEDMKGESAKTNMSGLDFKRAWKISENGYPVPVIYERPDYVWDGNTADGFAGGTGEKDDPYLIENGNQLYKMVSEFSNASTASGASNEITYFKLKNDIYLNDISADDLKNPSVGSWSSFATPWYSGATKSAGFCGDFDGDGHTVYGLYCNNNRFAGLIPMLTEKGNIHNVNLKDSYIRGYESSGGIAGYVYGHYTLSPASISYCTVNNVIIEGGAKQVGGIVGGCNDLGLTVSDCSVTKSKVSSSNSDNPNLASGLIGYGWGGVKKVINCFTDDSVHPVTSATNKDDFDIIDNFVEYTNVYTAAEKNFDAAEGVKYLTQQEMQGEKAKQNMKGFDFVSVWKTTENGYPVINLDLAKIWDGTKAESFAGGSGTETDPFLIENGGQLYKMVADYSNTNSSVRPESHTYFKIISDINLGNKQWYTTGLTNYPDNEVYADIGFSGIVYGGGHTIYGLYSNKKSATVGLIPVACQGAEIYDLHLENGNLPKADWDSYVAGGFIGMVKGTSNSKPIVIKGCSVKNFKIESRDASSAFVGYVRSQSVEIYNCYVVDNKISHTSIEAGMNTGAFIGVTGGNDWLNHITIANSYCDDVSPLIYLNEKFAAITTFENVYTLNDAYDNSVSGLKKLTSEQMTGETAKEYMKLDFDRAWKTTQDGYPVHVLYIKPSNVWDGKIAEEFAGGNGTSDSPYLIENGAQLYKMVKEYTNSATASGSLNKTIYFKLTSDIYLNDVKESDLVNPSEAVWGSLFNSWYGISNKNFGFSGDLDGDGYTVYGLYCANSRFAGLIPLLTDSGSVHNLNLKNSYIKGYESAGGIVGYVSGHYLLAPANVSYCTVDSVKIEGTAKQIGGIVGGCNDLGLTVTDCSVTRSKITSSNKENPNLASGIIGYGWGGVKNVINCFTDSSVHPITATDDKESFDIIDNFVSYTNVYTSAKKNFDAAEEITYLSSDSKLKGNSVSEILKGFNFLDDWLANSDYPTIKKGAGSWIYDTNSVGEVWSGKIARFYASGEGTKESPYEIKTGGQLALLANDALNGKTVKKYYKITEDIILNDTSSPVWKKSANEWYTGKWAQAFRGHLDGGYHTISGLYLNKDRYNYKGSDYYGGLFACIGKNAVIEKLGIVNSSIVFGGDGKYVGAFAGFVDQYDMAETPFDEYPIIRECFADTTVYLDANSCGGFIGCATRPIRVEDSFFTGKVNSTGRGLFGYSKMGLTIEDVLVKNFYTADSDYAVLCNISYDNIKCENCYTSSAQDKEGLTRLFIDRMCGKEAKKNMAGFDFKKVWTVRGNNETPGLKGFNKDAYTNVMNPSDIVVSFETNCDMIVESITGKAYSKLTLPVPKRDGYIFEGWYAFSELDVPFDYDYFPTFNTILYAKWSLSGFEQNFERYEDSIYDYHMGYDYYRPTSLGYSAKYVRSGAKSMHRLPGTSEELDFLLFYSEELEVGKTYKMVYYATTDTENTSVDVSLVHLDWPDVYCDNNGVVKMATIDNLTDGNWQEFTYTFVAKSKWIAIRTSGDSSVYFDDFTLYNTNDKSDVLDDSDNNDGVESAPESSVPVSSETDNSATQSTPETSVPVSPETDNSATQSAPETSVPVSPEADNSATQSTPESSAPVSPETNNGTNNSAPETDNGITEIVPEDSIPVSPETENVVSVLTPIEENPLTPNKTDTDSSNNSEKTIVIVVLVVLSVLLVGFIVAIIIIKKRKVKK